MNYEPNIPWLTIDELEHIHKKSGIFQKKETRTIDQTLRILATRVLENRYLESLVYFIILLITY